MRLVFLKSGAQFLWLRFSDQNLRGAVSLSVMHKLTSPMLAGKCTNHSKKHNKNIVCILEPDFHWIWGVLARLSCPSFTQALSAEQPPHFVMQNTHHGKSWPEQCLLEGLSALLKPNFHKPESLLSKSMSKLTPSPPSWCLAATASWETTPPLICPPPSKESFRCTHSADIDYHY